MNWLMLLRTETWNDTFEHMLVNSEQKEEKISIFLIC
uniref:Uncharacterized protein n=1 Tax=Rhizophora mucronata TaxID=61149 RepID=A0A2P2QXD6_RHIMU